MSVLDIAALEAQNITHAAGKLLGAEVAHVLHPIVVVTLTEVAIAGVTDDDHDELARAELLGDLERAVHGGAAGSACEDAFLARETARGKEGILVRDLLHLVDDRHVQRADHEIVANALDPVDARLARAALVKLVVVDAAYGIGADNANFSAGLGCFLLQVLAGTGNRATGADAADEAVDLPVRVLPDLRARGQVVGLGIVHVVILIGVEAAGCLPRNALGDLHVALRMVMGQIGARDDDPRSVGLEHVDLFPAHLVGHGEHATIAAHRSGHREPEAGVTRGALHQGRAGPEQTGLFGAAHHVHRHAVLDRPAGIEVFELCEHRRHAFVGKAVELHERRLADELQYVFCIVHAFTKSSSAPGNEDKSTAAKASWPWLDPEPARQAGIDLRRAAPSGCGIEERLRASSAGAAR